MLLGGTQGGTSVEVDSQNISMILVSNLLKTLTSTVVVFTKTIKGNVHLRGSAYSVYNGYDASIPKMEQLAG